MTHLTLGMLVRYPGKLKIQIFCTLPVDLRDITDTSTFRKRLKSVLFDRAYQRLLLALLDVSYSGALQIP